MKLAALKKSVLVVSGVFVSAALVVIGCSSKNADNGSSNIDGGPFCPANLSAALDPKTSCQGEGFECPIGYACGSWAQQAYCTCTGGKFVCKTGRGEAINDVASAPCTAPGSGSDKECPSSQNGTEGTSCKTPGLQCFYTGVTCKGAESPSQDVCQCVTQPLPDGGPQLAFRCEIASCNPATGTTGDGGH